MMVTAILYKAIARSMTARYSTYATSIVSTMIMARLFTPEIFGVVAAISVFFTFFQLMSEAGLGPAIVNITDLNVRDRDGLFGLTVTIGLIFAIIFSSLAQALQNFYNIPRVDEIVIYVAISLFFFSSSVLPSALLLKDQQFFTMSNSGIVSEIISTLSVIWLAKNIDPLHALAAKSAISSSVSFFILWFFSKKTKFGRPSFGFQFSAVRPLLSFSTYQLGFNFVNYFSRNLDNILVGKLMGAKELGVYDKGYQLMRYPLMLLTFAMTPALQPVVNKISNDVIAVEKLHRDFTFKLSLVGACSGIVIYFLSEWIVLILLGSQWVEVTNILRILAIAIPVQVVLSTSGSFFQAMGRADVMFVCGLFGSVVLTSAIGIGVYSRDLNVLSWFLVFGFHICFVQAYYLMYKKIFKMSVRHHFLRMIPSCVIVICMICFYLMDFY